jgi:hypothetical protein
MLYDKKNSYWIATELHEGKYLLPSEISEIEKKNEVRLLDPHPHLSIGELGRILE